MVVGNNKSMATKTTANRWQFWLSWRCSDTTRGASPNGAYPGLHSKPLDAAIGRVPVPHCPGGAMVNKFKWNTQNTNKTQFLASNYGTFWSLVVCENFNLKTNPLFSSLMQQASCKWETPQFELKSSCTFLAIKRCQRTKLGKVIKLTRSSIK